MSFYPVVPWAIVHAARLASQPPTHTPMNEEILFHEEVDPLGSVSEMQPGIFCILNWTVIKPFRQMQL